MWTEYNRHEKSPATLTCPLTAVGHVTLTTRDNSQQHKTTLYLVYLLHRHVYNTMTSADYRLRVIAAVVTTMAIDIAKLFDLLLV